VTLTVIFRVVVPSKPAEAGLIVHVAFAGAPAQASVTVPLKPVGAKLSL
jgi:hypothetical protein